MTLERVSLRCFGCVWVVCVHVCVCGARGATPQALPADRLRASSALCACCVGAVWLCAVPAAVFVFVCDIPLPACLLLFTRIR